MGALAVIGFVLATMALAARSPRVALLWTIFLAPWTGFDADFGVRISAYQLAVAAVLAVTIVRSLQPGWRPAPVAAVRMLMLLLLFATLWSLFQLAFIPEAEVAKGITRSPEVRAVLQIVLFAFSLSPAVLIGMTMRTERDVRVMFTTFVVSLAVLAVVGWIQLGIWYATGTNPLPIGVVNDWLGGAAESRTASFDFASLALNRMNSFAGEPRGLGVELVTGLLMIQAIMLTARRVDWRRLGPLWVFLFVSAIPTYSTSAVAIWLVGTAALLVLPWFFGARLRRSPVQLAAAVGAVIALLALATITAEARGIPVSDLLAERTINRIDQNGAIEDFDLAIFDWLQAHPEALVLGSGLGNVHLYAAPYLSPEFLWYAEGVVFTAKPSYLRIISELGLVGFFLFSAWYAVLVLDVAAALRRRPESELAPIVPIATTIIVVFFATAISADFWSLAGALAATRTALGYRRVPLLAPPPSPAAAIAAE